MTEFKRGHVRTLKRGERISASPTSRRAADSCRPSAHFRIDWCKVGKDEFTFQIEDKWQTSTKNPAASICEGGPVCVVAHDMIQVVRRNVLSPRRCFFFERERDPTAYSSRTMPSCIVRVSEELTECCWWWCNTVVNMFLSQFFDMCCRHQI